MEVDKGGVGGGGGEGSSRVPLTSFSSSDARQRFYIELRPGETTIVSWKRLVKDANPSPPAVEPYVPVAQQSREAQFAMDECFQDERSTSKQDVFFVNTGKSEHINEGISSANCQSKKRRKNLSKAPEGVIDDHLPNKHAKLNERVNVSSENAPFIEQSFSHSHNETSNSERHLDGKLQDSLNSAIVPSTKKAAETIIKFEQPPSGFSVMDVCAVPTYSKETDKYKSGAPPYQNLGNNQRDDSDFPCTTHGRDWISSKQLGPTVKKISTEANELEPSKNLQRESANNGLPDLNIPAFPVQSLKSPSMHSQEFSTLRPKGTMLERAIRELEKIVAESRPSKMEAQDGDTSSIAIKRRLPYEVKQRLAKVARLAQSSQGKISEELINRLMSILGHLVQLRTLKRNLREMVLLGLSAKREKADRFEQIKKEVIEMIRLQAARQIHAQTNDFQVVLGSEGKDVAKGKYTMDSAVEDKICDLYDLYVQGMDEDKGPQIRKLYVELAELWPNGAMDNHGIKSAICRAKERRRVLYGHEKVQEHDQRKKLSTLKMEDVQGEANLISHQQAAARERLISGSSNHTLSLPTEMIYSTAIGEQNVGAAVKIGNPSSKGSTVNLHKQVKPEKMGFPMLKEQMKQQQPEMESRVRKLSLKPVREPHKSHKRPIGQFNDLNHQSAAPRRSD